MDTAYASRMRYLDAADVNNEDVGFDGLDVTGPDGQRIGDVDGFVIDPDARRVHYVVIDSGGWFTSRRLLLPVGHATLSPDRRALQTDVTREALRRLPEYDDDRFRELSDDELRAFERNTVVACCPDEPLEEVSVGAWGYESRRHYREPAWWTESRYAPERLRAIGRPEDAGTSRAPAAAVAPARETHDRDLVTARADVPDRRPGREADVSPHHGGRAQPGDVLGIETGGERTGISETAADEDKRRRDAERATRDE